MAGARARPGRLTNAYQRWRPNQKPSWSCMWNPLPNLTGSCARDANPLVCLAWSGVRLPGVTKAPIWLCDHSHVVLPIITGRGVKYTHNDHRNPTVPTHSGGPGLRRIPQGRHQSSEGGSHARPLRDSHQQNTPTHRRILPVHNAVAE